MKRIVSAANCGLIFRDNDPEDFARQLAAMAAPSVRADLGRRGRVTVTEKMHWGEDADRMLAALEAQLSSGNAS
jgi:hypothetical protein